MGNEQKWLSLDIQDLSRYIESKELSPVEVTKGILERIEQLAPVLNAFITVMADEALESARKAEQEILKGEWKGPLHGVPIALKDLVSTAGTRTTMGSEIYSDYIPDHDATIVHKLKQSGAVIIGKTNTHQFAYGPTGDVSFFGPVKNPYDLSKITGGSSSGSAAAVATALSYGAIGSDTGGSVRIPASACGIVGMKPTFGRVSKYGVYPLGYTLDHIGPLTRTIHDNAIMLNVLSGFDDHDPYSVKQEAEDFTRLLGKSIKGMVIGIPTTFYYENIQQDVKQAIDEAMDVFKHLGAEVRPVDIDLSDIPWAQLMTIRSEAYAIHEEHLKSQPDKLHPEVRERLVASENVKGSDYVKAQQIRHQVLGHFNRALTEVDVLLAPTLPIVPTAIGQREVDIEGYKEHVYQALLRLTGPTNSTGLPSLSVPCGFSSEGLPIGLQLIGKQFDETALYQVGFAFEQERSLPVLKWEL
jgi:aspartyl-tRNA(Asn)/glutamyl-tRNA(Gln) amidotransferase subunit A